jgi:hypothetical protein
MDMRTRMIVGWDLQLTANSTGVAIALQRCFDEYGLPGAIYFDNGREFKNYWLCGNEWKRENSNIDEDEIKRNIGVIAEAGVKIIFAKPYHGQSKPIERLWRTVHETFDKFEETYIGSNTAARPDEARVYQQKVSKMKKEDFEKIPTFEEIKRRFGRYVDWYNNKHEHAGRGMDGKTPVRVWRENAVEKREVPADMKPYLFTYRRKRMVRNGGISYGGHWYYNTDKVVEYIGQTVEVRAPLDSDEVVYVFSQAGNLLFHAEKLEYTGDVAADNKKVGGLRKANRLLIKERDKGRAELDRLPFATPAEAYAARKEPERLVAGGADTPLDAPAPKMVKPLTLWK